LTFNPTDFYELARWIVDQRDDESSLRTAISRVYYAAHLIALEKLVQMSWTPKGGGEDHSGVIRELRTRKFRQLGDRLKLLLELREHADYHLEATETVRNQYCSFCKKIRDSNNPTTQIVNKIHWAEVASVSGKCIPLLEKL